MRLRTVKVCEPRPYGKAKNRMLIAPVPALSYTDTCIHKRVVNSPIGIAHSTGVVLLENVYLSAFPPLIQMFPLPDNSLEST